MHQNFHRQIFKLYKISLITGSLQVRWLSKVKILILFYVDGKQEGLILFILPTSNTIMYSFINIWMGIVMIIALLVLSVRAINQDVIPSFPTCYVNVPFHINITDALPTYSITTENLPSFASFDAKSAKITGLSKVTGSWNWAVKLKNKEGRQVRMEYLLNIIDPNQGKEVFWVQKSKNYYQRKVEKPLRVLNSKTYPTAVFNKEKFTYKFGCQNQIGSIVYSFPNLPEGLSGNPKTGQITGQFTNPGLYTLGVQIGDQKGNNAQGYITFIVMQKQTNPTNINMKLNKILVNNTVPFIFDLDKVGAQQIAADNYIFEALGAVNQAKANIEALQQRFNMISINLSTAEVNADKAAVAASQTNTERQSVSQRLRQTNKLLNAAELRLNLDLFSQSFQTSGLKNASKNLEVLQIRFNQDQKALSATQLSQQNAQMVETSKIHTELKAKTQLQNSERDYNRTNEDFQEAKRRLQQIRIDQIQAQQLIVQRNDELSIAKRLQQQANTQKLQAYIRLSNAEQSRQSALQVLQNSRQSNEKAVMNQGVAEWGLFQAISSLNVASAIKQMADKTSLLMIAHGAPPRQTRLNAKYRFTSCKNNVLPRYIGSVRIDKNYGDRALSTTGNTILYQECTIGRDLIKEKATLKVIGVINIESRCIEAHSIHLIS